MPQTETGEKRDYAAVRYPMGVYDNRFFLFFDGTDIKKALFKGYEDDKFYTLKSLINHIDNAEESGNGTVEN